MEPRRAAPDLARGLGHLLPLPSGRAANPAPLAALVRASRPFSHSRSPTGDARRGPHSRGSGLGGHPLNHGRSLSTGLTQLLRGNHPADPWSNPRRNGGADQEGHEGEIDAFNGDESGEPRRNSGRL